MNFKFCKLTCRIPDVMRSNCFLSLLATGVSNMIAKLAKTCTLRISPEKLNFILSDKLASGGVSMWCELEQVSRNAQRPRAPARSAEKALNACICPTGEHF